MKLLIVTQTLDSKHFSLGFFVRWVLEFAKQCEQVTVFCLDKGEDIFPANVQVIQIPRTWKGFKIWPYVLVYQAFLQRGKYTHVFAHMNPEYVLSIGPLCRILKKKISLWYAHGSVTFRLKLATLLTHHVFSSTVEGFRYPTKKLQLVGQGIDLDLYKDVDLERGLRKPLSLVSIGRISASKRMELLLETVFLLKSEYLIDVECTVIGDVTTEADKEYLKTLKDYSKQHNLEKNILWKGAVPLTQAISILKESDIFVHFGNTGSLDKAILDAMVCGVIILSTNEAVGNVLQNISQDDFMINNSRDATVKIVNISDRKYDDIKTLRIKVARHVQANFSLNVLVSRIISVLDNRDVL